MKTDTKTPMVRVLGITLTLTTLLITPELSFDPINWGKLVVFSSGVLAALGLFLGNQITRKSSWRYTLLFLITMTFTASLFFSPGRFDENFWGIYGRANGYLTFVLLLLLFFLASQISTLKQLLTLRKYFLRTGAFFGLYLMIQLLDLDPVTWSYDSTFGTLGNINFASAFVGLLISLLSVTLFDFKNRFKIRILALIVIIVLVFIVARSGSLQGLFGFGYALIVFLTFRFLPQAKSFARKLRFLVLTLINVSTISILFAAGNNRIFGGFFYQETVAFRHDYWRAALEMIRHHPIFGVGFDSYGDWYRSSRDLLGASRTSVDRVSNSAHSILLDLGASSGVLALCFVFLGVACITLRAYKLLAADPISIKGQMATLWLAFLPQLIVGINNIGYTSWAIVFAGSLLSYTDSDIQTIDEKNRPKKIDKLVTRKIPNHLRKAPTKENEIVKLLPPGIFVRALLFCLLGFSISFPPALADAKFMQASLSGDFNKMMQVADSPWSSRYLLTRTLEASTQTGNGELVLETARAVTKKYPREIYAWAVISDLEVTPQELREKAEFELDFLDPYLKNKAQK
jgi:O-antigen ligase